MARRKQKAKTTINQLQSATNRLKLAAQTRPYFVKIAGGAWLGYRKPLSGPGAWVARVGNSEGKGWEKTLWAADDNGVKADGEKVLTFWQAKSEGASYIAQRDNPGIPGHDDGWQVLSKRGQRGRRGESVRGPQGEKGAKGDKGDDALEIIDWHIDPVNYRVVPFTNNGKAGKPLELRALFERFLEEVGAG